MKSELSIILAVAPDASTEKQVAAVYQNKAAIIELLTQPKVRKVRGPNKPKVTA